MPCFSNGPMPGTPDYDEWLPEVTRQLDSFIHVVDYYYAKAGIPVPQPDVPAGTSHITEPIDARENERVLQQILLHLDCDDVDVLQLHDIRLLLGNDPASKGHRYVAVLNHCFAALYGCFRERPFNESQWRACREPILMLDQLGKCVSDRKLRLFAIACCRMVPSLLVDGPSSKALEVAERYADGLASDGELTAAEEQASQAWKDSASDSPAAWAASDSASDAARNVVWATVENKEGEEKDIQTTLLRCICGSPFRPVAVNPAWRTDTAVALAGQMYESRDFGAMPILADALQDAGCISDDVLNHCRDTNQVHVRGCWVVDAVLGKS